jgi:hypothetical protein
MKYFYSDAFTLSYLGLTGSIIESFETEEVPAEFSLVYSSVTKNSEWDAYIFRVPDEWREFVVCKNINPYSGDLTNLTEKWMSLQEMKEILALLEVVNG